ncbi:MAG: HK97 gp10 family phage protein [Alphaproteobacteria bacterium]|nr:HK97 gp10 family phage protein [Alphaproteobacteria bacterium]
MYKSYRKDVDRKMQATKKKALLAVGIYAVGKMKRLVPVDTGRLKSSLQYHEESEELYIGSGPVDGQPVHYATFMEKQRPFIKPGVFDNINGIKKLVNKIFREEM